MQLTTYTDFSLRILLYLASHKSNARVTSSHLSSELHIPLNHLSKIVNQLGHLGYLTNTRGKGGGIELQQAPANINLATVVQQLEPSLDIVDCNKPVCPMIGNCQLKGILNDATSAFLSVLASKTLADILPNTTNS